MLGSKENNFTVESDNPTAKNLHLYISSGILPISKLKTSESRVIFSISDNYPWESNSK